MQDYTKIVNNKNYFYLKLLYFDTKGLVNVRNFLLKYNCVGVIIESNVLENKGIFQTIYTFLVFDKDLIDIKDKEIIYKFLLNVNFFQCLGYIKDNVLIEDVKMLESKHDIFKLFQFMLKKSDVLVSWKNYL